MKQLLIIRHAKSSLDALTDFDRPLNNRGQMEAAEMAQKLIAENITVDAFISSPALRAISTASYFFLFSSLFNRYFSKLLIMKYLFILFLVSWVSQRNFLSFRSVYKKEEK